MKTQEQKRAAHAVAKVNTLGSVPSEFIGYCNSLPFMIHRDGLGQTAAFFLMKGGDHKKILDHLTDWLKQPGNPLAGKQGSNLVELIANCSMTEYVAAQAEAMAYMIWYKKLAKIKEG